MVRKGKQPADEITSTQQSTMRSLLAKERSTRLEGSFGNEKNHYLLKKITAGTQSTELVWIFLAYFVAMQSCSPSEGAEANRVKKGSLKVT
jgi:hypothetical protein